MDHKRSGRAGIRILLEHALLGPVDIGRVAHRIDRGLRQPGLVENGVANDAAALVLVEEYQRGRSDVDRTAMSIATKHGWPKNSSIFISGRAQRAQ
jgi:hypothetical protein